MTTKQLQVVVRAHDHATAVFRGIASRTVASMRSMVSVAADVTIAVVGITRAIQTVHRAVVDNAAVNYLDDLAKASRRLGTSTEFLSQLAYTADLAGVGFDQLTAATEKFQDTIGRISLGTGSKDAVDTFRKLGINIRSVSGELRSMESLFPEVADRLSKLGAGERIAAARTIFGRGGAGVLNVIENGPGGVAKQFAEARQLGVSVTKEMTHAAEEYNDAIARVGHAWRGVKNELLVEIAPAMTEFANKAAMEMARIPNIARGVAATLRKSLTGDPDQSAASAKQLMRLLDAGVDVLEHGFMAIARTAAQVFVGTALVAFEAAAPRISDALRDVISPLTQSLPESYRIAPSLRGRVQQAEREMYATRRGEEGSFFNGAGLMATGRAAFAERSTFASGQVGPVSREEFVHDPAYLAAKSRVDDLRKQLARQSDAREAAVRDAITIGLNSVGTVFGEESKQLNASVEALSELLKEFEEIGRRGKPEINYQTAHREYILNARVGLAREFIGGVRGLFGGAAERLSGVNFRERLDAYGQQVRGLEARELSAQGLDRESERLQTLIRFTQELGEARKASLPAEYIKQLQRVQTIELSRFDAQTAATGAIEPLLAAQKRYGEEIARNAQLVEAGTLQEFQATRQNLQSAEAVRRLGEAAKEQIDTIITANPALAKFLEEYRDNVVRILGEIPTPRVSRSPTFGEGVEDGIDRLIERAQDFRAQGVEAFDTVADIGIGRLSSALTQGQTSFKEFAESAIRDVAELTTRLLLLRIVASGLKAFGFGGADAGAGVAAVDSLDTSTGAGVSFLSLNRGGRVGWPAGFARGGGLGSDFRMLGGPNVNRDTGVFAGTAGELVVSRNQVRSNGGHANLIAGLNRGDYGGGGGGGGTVINFNQVNHFAAGANVDSRTLAALQKASIDGLPAVIERSPAYRARMKGALA